MGVSEARGRDSELWAELTGNAGEWAPVPGPPLPHLLLSPYPAAGPSLQLWLSLDQLVECLSEQAGVTSASGLQRSCGFRDL